MGLTREAIRSASVMEREGGMVEVEIWPMEHPKEPEDEDKPVECPMPDSSVINVTNFSHSDDGKRERRLVESLRKRAEEHTKKPEKDRNPSSTVNTERPVRAIRKRQHNLTGGDDHRIVPLSRIASPIPTQNVTIYQILQRIEKYEP